MAAVAAVAVGTVGLVSVVIIACITQQVSYRLLLFILLKYTCETTVQLKGKF